MRKNKGITLIALIITIIVMLILVGVVVTVVIQSDLLGTAKTAGDKYKTAYEEESNMSEITINGKSYESIEDYINKTSILVVEPENVEDWKYDILEDNTITLTGYKGGDTEVVIPNYINGIPVKRIAGNTHNSLWMDEICTDEHYNNTIGQYVYKQNTITSIKVSEGIESIGFFTFTGSLALEKVSLPQSLKEIKAQAFVGCSSLKEITIPRNVTTCEANIFTLIPSITVHVPWKEGEKPEGWNNNWNYAYSDCTITVDYAK